LSDTLISIHKLVSSAFQSFLNPFVTLLGKLELFEISLKMTYVSKARWYAEYQETCPQKPNVAGLDHSSSRTDAYLVFSSSISQTLGPPRSTVRYRAVCTHPFTHIHTYTHDRNKNFMPWYLLLLSVGPSVSIYSVLFHLEKLV
jgi:hypothetical protein